MTGVPWVSRTGGSPGAAIKSVAVLGLKWNYYFEFRPNIEVRLQKNGYYKDP
jgi:hypothetical protein